MSGNTQTFQEWKNGGRGSSGGGGGSATPGATPGTTPSGAPGTLTLAPFFGNNQSALASQLAMGFGGTPESFMQSPLMQLFQPQTIPNYAAGAPLIPPAPKKKKK